MNKTLLAAIAGMALSGCTSMAMFYNASNMSYVETQGTEDVAVDMPAYYNDMGLANFKTREGRTDVAKKMFGGSCEIVREDLYRSGPNLRAIVGIDCPDGVEWSSESRQIGQSAPTIMIL